MKKHEKAAIYSEVCQLEAWLEFTTDEQHKRIIEGVRLRLKRMIQDMYPKENGENSRNVLTR